MSDKKIQKCLNPDCNEVLFVSASLGPTSKLRGVDREIKIKKDEEGGFIECPKCFAKHTVFSWIQKEGTGVQWQITGLRT